MDASLAALTEELEDFSKRHGADLFGVADLGLAEDFVKSQCAPAVAAYPRAVSVGMQLNDTIVEGQNPQEPRRSSIYWHHVYNVVTPALDFLAFDVTRWLTHRGFRAFPVPASMPYDDERLQGLFSHKLAARLAGIGWIGKSCLLLTERYGPRVRFASILTDAPLKIGQPLDRPCGKCRICVEACPVGAFTGVEFQPEEGREIRFDAFKCRVFRKDHPCGTCVAVCPHGKSRKRKE